MRSWPIGSTRIPLRISSQQASVGGPRGSKARSSGYLSMEYAPSVGRVRAVKSPASPPAFLLDRLTPALTSRSKLLREQCGTLLLADQQRAPILATLIWTPAGRGCWVADTDTRVRRRLVPQPMALDSSNSYDAYGNWICSTEYQYAPSAMPTAVEYSLPSSLISNGMNGAARRD